MSTNPDRQDRLEAARSRARQARSLQNILSRRKRYKAKWATLASVSLLNDASPENLGGYPEGAPEQTGLDG